MQVIPNFYAKLLSMPPRLHKFCPGFYNWCLTKFLQSAIQSAREGIHVVGLYYQNNIESFTVSK